MIPRAISPSRRRVHSLGAGATSRLGGFKETKLLKCGHPIVETDATTALLTKGENDPD
jgi:hypothetical protein